jgi:hypothetical protein
MVTNLIWKVNPMYYTEGKIKTYLDLPFVVPSAIDLIVPYGQGL